MWAISDPIWAFSTQNLLNYGVGAFLSFKRSILHDFSSYLYQNRCSRSKTRVGGLCCLVLSQKPGSGVCVTVFALKNCPCSLSKTLIGFPVVALKNPGRGLMLIVCTLKNSGEGFCCLVRSQKPW